jgi:hypothetical protein
MRYGVFPIQALLLLITFSHYYFLLNSMLKKLLCICVSLLPLALLSQQALPDDSSPSERVFGDPAQTLSVFRHSIIDRSKVLLDWQVKDSLPEFFAIERSSNGTDFEVVTVLNNLGRRRLYEWVDESPLKGRSFYRIRYSFDNGPELFSATIPVVVAGQLDLKFYPNPVDHILIVRSESPVDVQISDAAGKIRISENRVTGLHTINVSALDKGIYLIRFTNKLTNIIIQEKLVKN